MEKIRQAVERARASVSTSKSLASDRLDSSQRFVEPNIGLTNRAVTQIEETQVHGAHLLGHRIVSHNGADHRSRPYDMLRTQVLQSMASNAWTVLGVTSPTAGCGKTVTAINLAFSVARQRHQSAVLVDMDLQKPRIADYLGLTPRGGGVLAVLEGRANLHTAAITVRAGNQQLVVLPSAATRESSELMGSRATGNLLQEIKETFQSHIIILDLPPILASDDVIALLPQIDCVLLVAAVGLSKASEIEESSRHLKSTHLVRLVVNKAAEAKSYYYQPA
jgi:protein-tyrosine kinase